MHNGLARKEDFPYITYSCPHCNALNRSKNLEERVSGPGSPDMSASTSVDDVNTISNASGSMINKKPTSSSIVQQQLLVMLAAP
ncbi:hypothetical protein F0562_033294 [Nyssa sinensis]|uniref:Lunapark zinc ribbon domain-containing protein n=1 Tax=Nyssa sinensis TaxID=561372 RepID=A0A5J5AQ90_9ASTE|nr:hypothetical protein F0562_033294 [Nyssa sinensis]